MVHNEVDASRIQEMDSGERRLNELGYKQELRREMTLFKTLAISFSTMTLFTGITPLYGSSLLYAGPASLVWGWVVVSFFTCFVGVAMAEICSSFPTTGSLYFWAAHLAGPKWGPFASWCCAWLETVGLIAGIGTQAYAGSQTLQSIILLSTGTNKDGGYLAPKWLFLCMYIGLTVIWAFLNTFALEVIAFIDIISIWWQKKSGGEGKEQDHYALLGLSHLRYLATEEQIRKSYRETALKYHPDKQAALLLNEVTEAAKQTKKDEIESHFKSIQEAYEALIDPVKRRIYDSTDEFDDEIPTECAPQDFFRVFSPAFMRNGRWSVSQPIPFLGDESTPLKEVDNFYDFWYTFKSWREFPHADEFDLEQAESRDHKRWMERQNSKLSEKARKEEYARIRTLVDNAYKRDPRIQRRKEAEKAEKQRKKEAKYLAKKLQEEEAVRAAEEESKRKEEEAKRAAETALQQKKLKEKEKKLLRKEKARLRTVSGPVTSKRLLNLSEDDVESLCSSLGTGQLRSICEKMEGKEGVERAEVLRDACGYKNDLVDKKEEEKKTQQQNGSVETKGTVQLGSYEKKEEKPWSKEEIELLRKGMVKFPKGTSRRWEVVSDYIGTGRSVEEILKATKTVLLQKPDSSKAFDSFLEKRKPSPSIASPLTTRVEVEGVPTPQATETPAVKTDESGESSSGSAKDQTPIDPIVENGLSSGSEQDVWSAVHERALVQALKTFPKDAAQRWERVAAAVPGKSVVQCKKKFALMKESFRNKKSTA